MGAVKQKSLGICVRDILEFKGLIACLEQNQKGRSKVETTVPLASAYLIIHGRVFFSTPSILALKKRTFVPYYSEFTVESL